jgi:peptidoglycan/LPS O-acetylase OafA/YrhL
METLVRVWTDNLIIGAGPYGLSLAAHLEPHRSIADRQDRLPAIDGLRAIAMTMVIAQHCGLLPCGWTGVWLFYVISGFVITRTLLAERLDRPGLRYMYFMQRRLFRIVPVYLLYLLLNLGVMAGADRFGSLRDMPFLISFTYNWQMIFQIWQVPVPLAAFGHLWTLSVEEQFYLIFPLLFLFLPRRVLGVTLALLVLAGPAIRLVFAGWLVGMPEAQDPNWSAYAVYAASFTQFDAFLLGAIVSLGEPWLRGSRRALWIPVVAAVAAAVYVVIFVSINHALGARGLNMLRNIVSGTMFGQEREVFVYSVVDLVAVSAILFAMRGSRGTSWLRAPTLCVVGRVSYGGYLFHALALLFAARLLGVGVDHLPISGRIVAFAGVWAVTVTAAYASLRWFESRVIAWAKLGRPRSAARNSTACHVQP